MYTPVTDRQDRRPGPWADRLLDVLLCNRDRAARHRLALLAHAGRAAAANLPVVGRTLRGVQRPDYDREVTLDGISPGVQYSRCEGSVMRGEDGWPSGVSGRRESTGEHDTSTLVAVASNL